MTWPEPQRATIAVIIKANGAKGEAAIDHGVERFVALPRDVRAFDLSPLESELLGPPS